MAVTPTSRPALSRHGLRRLIASSAVFQTLVGAANEAEALNHVYMSEAIDASDDIEPKKPTHPRPRAIIDRSAFSLDVGVGALIERHELEVSFEFPPPSTVVGDMLDESTWFDNQWGGIVDQMATNSGQHNGSGEGYFAINMIVVAEMPMPNDPREDPHGEYYWGVRLTVSGPQE